MSFKIKFGWKYHSHQPSSLLGSIIFIFCLICNKCIYLCEPDRFFAVIKGTMRKQVQIHKILKYFKSWVITGSRYKCPIIHVHTLV